MLYDIARHGHYFTRWNLMLGLVPGIAPEFMLLNSGTTWISYHMAGTNGAKTRTRRHCRLSIGGFLVGDALLHTVPVIYWMRRAAAPITRRHLLAHIVLVVSYYAFVGQGLDCQHVYGVSYPWQRQVMHAALSPLLIQYAWNALRHGDARPLCALWCWLWTWRDVYELLDAAKLTERGEAATRFKAPTKSRSRVDMAAVQDKGV